MQWELDALRQAGIEFTVDDKALADRRLRIEFRHKVNGIVVEGEALFPDAYPYFRPAVNAKQLGLSHHQNPLGELGNLCLLGRAGDLWQPRCYNLAWLLTHQLPSMLSSGKLGATPEERAVEDVQAEPYSAYLPCAEDTGLILDSSWDIPSNVTWGRLVIGIPEPPLNGAAVRGVVLQVLDPDRNVLAEADASVASSFPYRAHGRWVRSELEDPHDPLRVVEELKAIVPSNALQSWPGIPSPRGEVQVLGVLFPEEVSHRHPGSGWYFVCFIKTTRGKKKKTANIRMANPPFLRPLYGGPEDLSLRVPELEPLRSKTVAVFGLGTLGAPAALEFGRAGVGHLRILDHDFADPGPSVRWPFGLREAGRKKVDVIKEFLQQQYPYTSVQAEPFKIGEPPIPGRKTDQRVMDEMLSGADLLFDATASLEVQKYIFDEAQVRGVPYLSVVGRPGGWGGIVYRYRPGEGRGCWHCFQRAIADGSILDAPSDSANGVQPRGCGDVTFTGTSFDMGTIALDAVRRAVATLCHDEGGYPDQEWDVAVIALRNDDGSPCAPTWSLHTLHSREDCRCSGGSE